MTFFSDKFLNATRYIMIYKPNITILRENAKGDAILTVDKKSSPIIVDKEIITKTPIWIYIVACLGGVALLLTMVYALNKLGFFQRKIKQKLIKEKRESLFYPMTSQAPSNLEPKI